MINPLDELRLARLSDFAKVRATCPCCDETQWCLPDCTYEWDSPTGAEVMRDARYALFGDEPERSE